MGGREGAYRRSAALYLGGRSREVSGRGTRGRFWPGRRSPGEGRVCWGWEGWEGMVMVVGWGVLDLLPEELCELECLWGLGLATVEA